RGTMPGPPRDHPWTMPDHRGPWCYSAVTPRIMPVKRVTAPRSICGALICRRQGANTTWHLHFAHTKNGAVDAAQTVEPTLFVHESTLRSAQNRVFGVSLHLSCTLLHLLALHETGGN